MWNNSCDKVQIIKTIIFNQPINKIPQKQQKKQAPMNLKLIFQQIIFGKINDIR